MVKIRVLPPTQDDIRYCIEYARTGNAVDFLEMMADFKNEFEW